MRFLVLAAALGLTSILPPAARADVTPAQVYDSWTAAAGAMGGTLSAVVERGPGRMVLNGLTFTHSSGLEVALGPVTLVQTPERTVEIALPERFDLVLRRKGQAIPGRPKRVVFSVAMPGFRGFVTGLDDAATGYGLTAGSVSVALDRVEPALPGGQSLALTLAAADLDIAWDERRQGAGKAGAGHVALGTIHGDLSYALDPAPSGPGAGEASFDLAGLKAGLDVYITPRMLGRDPADPGRDMGAFLNELRQGLALTMQAETGPAAARGTMTGPEGEPVSFDIAVDTAGGRFGIDTGGFDYATWLGPGRADLSAPKVDGAAGAYGLGWQEYRSAMTAGLLNLTVEEPWSFLFRLTGVTLSDGIWAEADPAGALPRDPAAAVLDIGGTFALDPVVLRPGGMPAEGEDLPLTAVTVGLRELLVAGLGLEFTGTGGVSLDFTRRTGPEGAPEAAGRLDFLTRGATALIGRLEQAGLVPPDEVSSLRFGLLFLGRAGAEPDTLETSVEFRDGHLYLNGQLID